MIPAALKAICRRLHRGEYVRPSKVGASPYRCLRCGAGFADLAEAGALRLDEWERTVSPSRMAQLGNDEALEASAMQLDIARARRGRFHQVVTRGQVHQVERLA